MFVVAASVSRYVSTVDARTTGVVTEPMLEVDRMITSSPSKFRAESLEFSSVSGLTGSVLTMAGKRTLRRSRT